MDQKTSAAPNTTVYRLTHPLQQTQKDSFGVPRSFVLTHWANNLGNEQERALNQKLRDSVDAARSANFAVVAKRNGLK